MRWIPTWGQWNHWSEESEKHAEFFFLRCTDKHFVENLLFAGKLDLGDCENLRRVSNGVLYTGFKCHSLCALIDVSEFWNSWPDTRKRLIDLIVSFVLNVWFSPKCSYNCWLLKNLQTYHKRIKYKQRVLKTIIFKIRPAWFDTVVLNQNCTLGIFLI